MSFLVSCLPISWQALKAHESLLKLVNFHQEPLIMNHGNMNLGGNVADYLQKSMDKIKAR
jgi:hypothetical protein